MILNKLNVEILSLHPLIFICQFVYISLHLPNYYFCHQCFIYRLHFIWIPVLRFSEVDAVNCSLYLVISFSEWCHFFFTTISFAVELNLYYPYNLICFTCLYLKPITKVFLGVSCSRIAYPSIRISWITRI